MSKPSFVYVTYITTTPEKLWKALTTSEFTKQFWFGTTFDCDWRKGSKMSAFYPDGKVVFDGEVLESNPYTRLSYTFIHQKPNVTPEPASRVTYELEATGEVVKLTVLHDQFEAGSEVFKGISNGWPMILAGVKSLLETGKPLPQLKTTCGDSPKPAAASK